MKNFKQLMEDFNPEIVEEGITIKKKKNLGKTSWGVFKDGKLLSYYSNENAANIRADIEREKLIKETVEAPRSEAERNFVKKHVVQVIDKTLNKDKEVPEKDRTRQADYKDGEDALVYEDLQSLVNEALCEGLSLKVGIMKFDDGSQCVVTRSDIDKLEKVYASTDNKLEMEKSIKKSKEDFKQLVAIGESFVVESLVLKDKATALEYEKQLNDKAFENNKKYTYGVNKVPEGWEIHKFDRSSKTPKFIGKVSKKDIGG